MTAFAAIIGKEPVSQNERTIFENLISQLTSQKEGFRTEKYVSQNLIATKLWLPHSRTKGIAEDETTNSWLCCIGNPTNERYSAIPSHDYAKALLEDYLHLGPEAITSLNAPYVIIVYDGREKNLNVVTDRVGLQHIYLARLASSFILSTSSLALASTMKVHVDRHALAHYFLIGYLLEQRTFFKEIGKLDGAVWATFTQGKINQRKYWYPPSEAYTRDLIETCAINLADKLKQAVSSRLDDLGRTSVELTGGLDTRFNLACAAVSAKDFHAWTIGERGSKEVCIAERLRQIRGFQHHILSPVQDIEKRFIGDLKLINTLTDGEVDCLNLIASPSCNRQTASFRDASISGVGGEILRGFYYITHKGVPNYSNKIRTKRLISLKMLPNTGFKPEIFSKVFPSDYQESLKVAVERYLSDTESSPLFWRLDDFYFRAREQRFAGRSCSLNNFFYRQELPFFDNYIIHVSFTIPWEFKKNSRLVKHALALCHPGYAEVPLINGLPARPLSIRDWRQVAYYYANYTRKISNKVQYLLFGESRASSDDIGLASIISKKLASTEVADMLNPDNMASGFLYNPDKFRDFIRANRNNGFKDRAQIGLILSFELTCRYIGHSLVF